MKPMNKVTLIGLGAMGVFFAPRISEKLGAGFRIMASGRHQLPFSNRHPEGQ